MENSLGFHELVEPSSYRTSNNVESRKDRNLLLSATERSSLRYSVSESFQKLILEDEAYELDLEEPNRKRCDRGLCINGTCFTVATLLGIACILVAFIGDPDGNMMGVEDSSECRGPFELWLYIYGCSIIILQLLSAISIVLQRKSIQKKQTCQWLDPAKRLAAGKILFIIVQFLQLPLLAWIAFGCYTFFRFPFGCTSEECVPNDAPNSIDDNSSNIKLITLNTTVTTTSSAISTTTTTVDWSSVTQNNSSMRVNSTGPPIKVYTYPSWPDECVREHQFGWVLIVAILSITILSWMFTLLVVVISAVARKQQKELARKKSPQEEMGWTGKF